VLALAGRATIAGESWHRGCYAFDATAGHCDVHETLQMYVRSFVATAI
jgi:hypothetical protein